MDTHTELKYISLYAGGGGLDLAFKLANPGARAVCYVEREASSIALLVDHMQTNQLDDAPVFADSGTFDGKPWRGKVDFIIGGFPCQPASVAGRRSGQDDERWLFPHIRRIVSEAQPQGLFLENVRGLLSVNGGDGFEEILRDLADLRYNVEWGVYKASDVGASHRRERAFIYAQMADPRHDGQELQTQKLPQGYELQSRNGVGETLSIFGSSGEQLVHPYSKGRKGSQQDSEILGATSEPSSARIRAELEGRVQSGYELADSRYDARSTESEQQREESSEVFAEGSGASPRSGEQLGFSYYLKRQRQVQEPTKGSHPSYGSGDNVVGRQAKGLADPDDSGISSFGYGIEREGSQGTQERENRSQSESTGHSSDLGDSRLESVNVQRAGIRSEHTGASSELVNTDGGGRRSESDSELPSEGIDFGRRPFPWPPRPTSPEWGQILSERPDLAPAQSEVRGMVNGLAGGLGRADKLRILGNGVVPQQAAIAFLMLENRMLGVHEGT